MNMKLRTCGLAQCNRGIYLSWKVCLCTFSVSLWRRGEIAVSRELECGMYSTVQCIKNKYFHEDLRKHFVHTEGT